jgi:hypothetical protein
MGQSFIIFLIWVDVHGIYYIIKKTKFDDFLFFYLDKTNHFQLEWREIELKQLLQEWRWLKIPKDIINGYACICRKTCHIS